MPGLGSCTAKQLARGGILNLGQLRNAKLEEVLNFHLFGFNFVPGREDGYLQSGLYMAEGPCLG